MLPRLSMLTRSVKVPPMSTATLTVFRPTTSSAWFASADMALATFRVMRELLGLRRDEVHHTNIESFQVHNRKNARFGLDAHPFLIFSLSLPGATVDDCRTSMQSRA